jgi:peptidoglycan/xylan/chitin deacetylase (PgdA/CDA1 family)
VEAHQGQGPLVAHGAIFAAPGAPASILAHADQAWYRNYNRRLESQGGAVWPDGTYLISNSSMPRSTLLACGGLDENLLAKDDFDLGLRLWKMGVRFRYLRDALAYEFTVKSSRSFLFKEGEAFGRSEVMLCRKHPDYRTRSHLAALSETVWWRRLLRRVILQSPVSPVHLLTLPVAVCDKLCRYPAFQKAGLRLLELGRRFSELRAALKETGSWKAFQSEFCARLPVLLYHHIGPSRPGAVRGLTVSPQRFERHMRWLARRGYTGICPADWQRWRREGKGLAKKPLLLTFDDGYADLAEYAFPVLRRHGFSAGVYLVTAQMGGASDWDGVRGAAAQPLLTAEQVRYWATQGIEFDAHGRTHADLTKLSAQELAEEVVGSRDDLAALVGSPVVSFAYPYGFYNQAVVDCVRRAFDLAFIANDNNEGLNHLLTDPHLLLRTMVQTNDSWLDLESRALWGHNPLLNLRARLRLRSRLKHAASAVLGGRKRRT